jgi:hypothetical protein
MGWQAVMRISRRSRCQLWQSQWLSCFHVAQSLTLALLCVWQVATFDMCWDQVWHCMRCSARSADTGLPCIVTACMPPPPSACAALQGLAVWGDRTYEHANINHLSTQCVPTCWPCSHYDSPASEPHRCPLLLLPQFLMLQVLFQLLHLPL